jgi:aromatic-L-amino-acid decarboxylase
LSITPEYLRDAASDSGAVVDYRDWQVSLGRRFRALKLWTVLAAHGLEGLRAHIRGHVALARGLADRVSAEPGFALAAPPSLALVCLRVDTGEPEADDRATRELLAAVNASGRAFVTHTVVDGRYAIRVAVGGVTTGSAEVDALWELLCTTAARIGEAGVGSGPA